jgi:protein AroM
MAATISGDGAVQQGAGADIVSGMLERITFLTIGQTPRADLVPEILSALPRPVQAREWGALDGLSAAEIGSLAPDEDDHALVTRLRDGSQAVIGKRWVTGRIQAYLDRRSNGGPPGASIADGASAAGRWRASEATVLLCTGDFSGLRPRDHFLDSQHLVDGGVDALCHGAESIGLLVPLDRQQGEHHYRPPAGQRLRATYASPYDAEDDFATAGRALAVCDLVVMHCMGYTEAQRAVVAEASGRPVLLARRMVASALSQLL